MVPLKLPSVSLYLLASLSTKNDEYVAWPFSLENFIISILRIWFLSFVSACMASFPANEEKILKICNILYMFVLIKKIASTYPTSTHGQRDQSHFCNLSSFYRSLFLHLFAFGLPTSSQILMKYSTHWKKMIKICLYIVKHLATFWIFSKIINTYEKLLTIGTAIYRN